MAGRTIAIGDIHGHARALRAVLEAIDPHPADTIITLGDYVDRGPDSPGVIETLIALKRRRRLISLLGNHDEVFLDLRHGALGLKDWLGYGGRETLAAYRCGHPQEVPESHAEFLHGCVPYHETSTHFFVHANYLPNLPLDEQPDDILMWRSLRDYLPGPHSSGKIAVVGHTAQKNGEILDLGYLKCIDTCCYCGKWLTALDVRTGEVWQADPKGRRRHK